MATAVENKLAQLTLAHRRLEKAQGAERELLLARIDRLLEDYYKLLTPVPV
jgi:hypothetical protein